MNTHTIIDKQDAKAVNTGAKAQSSLYAAHEKVFPKRAEGTFRKLKWIIMAVTLGIYYLTPWLRWDRGPFAPDQAVLVDLANRRFYFLFIEIWPQEFYFVAGLLIMAGFGLFLVTSTVGRAWCGYTCPQTVWVDLFLVVERAVEGDVQVLRERDDRRIALRVGPQDHHHHLARHRDPPGRLRAAGYATPSVRGRNAAAGIRALARVSPVKHQRSRLPACRGAAARRRSSRSGRVVPPC